MHKQNYVIFKSLMAGNTGMQRLRVYKKIVKNFDILAEHSQKFENLAENSQKFRKFGGK